MTRRWRLAIVTGAGVLGLAPVATAQEISRGLSLVGLTVSCQYADHSSAMDLGLGLERLITGRVSATAELGYNRTNGDSSGEAWAASSYYFRSRRSGSPYASARIGYSFGGDVNPLAYGADIGYLRLLGAKRGAALKVELSFRHHSHKERVYDVYQDLVYGDGPLVIPSRSTNDMALAAGFSLYFHSKR